jgi:hypothetical protein
MLMPYADAQATIRHLEHIPRRGDSSTSQQREQQDRGNTNSSEQRSVPLAREGRLESAPRGLGFKEVALCSQFHPAATLNQDRRLGNENKG